VVVDGNSISFTSLKSDKEIRVVFKRDSPSYAVLELQRCQATEGQYADLEEEDIRTAVRYVRGVDVYAIQRLRNLQDLIDHINKHHPSDETLKKSLGDMF